MTFINLKKSIAFYREYAIIDLSNEREVNRMSIENYYLLRRLEELQNEIANNVDSEKHDK